MKNNLGKFFTIFFFFFFLISFVLFSISNKYTIKINLFPMPFVFEAPFYIYSIVIFFLGFFLGIIFKFFGNFFK